MKTVYIIISRFGIEGVFSSNDKAENYVSHMKNRYAAYRDETLEISMHIVDTLDRETKT